jgi:hypothetical protein
LNSEPLPDRRKIEEVCIDFFDNLTAVLGRGFLQMTGACFLTYQTADKKHIVYQAERS